jgi:glucosamine--fructose-6-phosphate aminotransferase (isomerizing)
VGASLRDLSSDDYARRAWALGNLIELYLLAPVTDELNQAHGQPGPPPDWNALATQYAKELAKMARPGAFEIFSTRRQIVRYLDLYVELCPSGALEAAVAIAEQVARLLPPHAVRRQRGFSGSLTELAAWCRQKQPQLVVTCARGSSAHAATFGKHLIERYLGIPVVVAAPNIATVYGRRLQLAGQLLLTISQSGRSDDLAEFARMGRAAGALTAAIVNDVESPLAGACDITVPMAAGPELSVAATKTFVAALAVLLRLIGAWTEDHELRAAIDRLPDRLEAAGRLDWSSAATTLSTAQSLITVGRGPTLAIAREAALKLKETCNLHAEAFSGAEFQHGPVALVSPLYPILMFMPTDAAWTSMRDLAADLQRKNAALFAAEPGEPAAGRLPALDHDHPDTDAVCLIQSFYALAIHIAGQRGTNVDRPRHLQKVTRTR